MRGRHLATGAAWLGLYVALTLAPLGFVFLTARGSGGGRPFWTELSVALGFVGLAMMCLQFVLTARFGWLKAPYGSDVVYRFHKVISLVAVGMVLLHPALLFATRWEAMLERPRTHPWPFWIGTLGVLALVWLVVVSIWRERLGISYDAWRRAHAALAVVAIGAGIAHVLMVGHYLSTPWQRGLWLVYTLLWVGLIVYVRVAKPAMELRRPYEVAGIKAERGGAWSVTLRPRGHEGMRFSPGQFAWLTAWDSPFSDREHPFSFSGSAERAGGRDGSQGELRFTIKALGDWTSRVRELTPGQTVYVDGPFGALSADRFPDAEGFGLFAGGIGITPMMSHVLTFRDRGDTRPLWLFYGGKDWESLTLREELEALRREMPSLRVVYVLGSVAGAPVGEAGGPTIEEGFISAEVVRRHAPEIGAAGRRIECFICGPQPMMDATERLLHELGVPLGDFHSERFNLV